MSTLIWLIEPSKTLLCKIASKSDQLLSSYVVVTREIKLF